MTEAAPLSQNIDLACADCYNVENPNGQILLTGGMTPEEFAEAVDEAVMEYAIDMGFCTE